VSVLFTGRPVPISNIFETSTAVIAGWLPGTSGGQSVVNLISGAYVAKPGGASDRKNTLSMDWPKSMVIFILFRNLLKTSLFILLMAQFPKLMMCNSVLVMALVLLVIQVLSSKLNDYNWIKNLLVFYGV